jgi:6-phosphogluconolactonase (cycloisomerase 2 family)
VDRAGRFAYVVSPNSFDISAYTINPAIGALTAVSGSPFATGSQPASAAVDPTGHFVYVANSLSNNVSAYKIDPSTGALAAVSGSPFAAGTAPHSVTVDPSGQFVYVANLTSSNISAYTINPSTGTLAPVLNSPFTAGLSPCALTVDPTGRFVFVADESNNISAYVINPATGALAAVSGAPFATESQPASLTVDPTGRFLYVTNTGSNSVSAYTIDSADGALTAISGSPFPVGIGPFSAALDPAGHRAYVTSTASANIFAYTIDSATGALTAQSGSPFVTEGVPESMAAASVSGPVLGIANSHAGNFIQGQSGVTYSIAVGNTGAGATNGVVTMAERVPAGLTLVSMAGSGWKCASGSVICTRIDSLAAGAIYPPIAVTMNVAANAPPSVTNVVSISGFGTATAVASDTASVAQLPALTIASSHAGDFYQGQRGATYSIAVSNTGPGATSGPVTVNDTVPSGLTLVSLAGDGWTCPGNGASCNRNDALASGASYPSIAVTVNVAANAPETVTNQVSVSGGGAAAANASDPTVIPQPVLTVATSHTGNFTQGQNGATYSVTVSNGPVTAPGAPLLNASTIAVAIGASSCNDYQSVTLTSSGASIPFTVAVNYPNGTSNGDNNGAWLYATIAGSGATSTGTTVSSTTGTTGVTLTIGLNRSIGAVTDTGQVIITPTNSPASAPVTITVFYQQTINCGSGGFIGNGFINVTPGNIAFTAATSGQQSTSVSIQNITGSGLTFGYSVSPSGSWLSASATTTTISANLSTPLNITANAVLTAGVGIYTGFVTVTPQTGFGTVLNIPVTFTVTNGTGTDSGTLTVNGATSNTYSTAFDYAAPNPPGGLCVPLQDTAPGANSYTSMVTTSNGGNWLLANNQLNIDTVQILAPGTPNACVELTLNPTVAYNLASGAYEGSVALTSSSGSTATINVNYYVSAGAAPGVTPIPGAIYVFPIVAPGSSVVQQEPFTISALSGVVLAPPALTGADGFSISAPIASGNVETFTVMSNSTGLAAGIYSTTITVQSSGSFSGTTTITLVLPVVQPAASPLTVGPSSLAFQQQSGSSFWTSGKEAQAITISGAQGTQWSAFVVYGSGANWLTFDSPAGGSGTLGSGPSTLIVDLFNGVSSLSPSSTPYAATVNITTTSGTFIVAVSLLVTPATGPVLLGVPASATFWATTSSSSTSQTVTVVGSDDPTSTTLPPIVAGTPTATWVTATASGNTLTIGVNAAGLSTGVYSATIPVSAGAYSDAVNYPVVMIVSGAGGASGKGITSTIGQVTVTESVPSELELVSMVGTGWNCPTGGDTCTRSDSIDAGASYSAITVTVNVANTAPPSVVNQVSASGAGSASANATDTTTIISPCALTQDGSAGVADVQRVINEALGMAQAVDDLNLDGAVNVVDIQIVMNASLGLGCTL